MIGIDCSNYGGPLSIGQARAMVAAGISFAIIGTQNEAIARDQANACREAGIRTDFYYYPLYNAEDEQRIQRARQLGFEFGAEYLWDDVEWWGGSGPQPPANEVRDGITWRVAQLWNDFKVGIYTSPSQWVSMTNGLLDGQIDPKVNPLWHATYFYDRRVPDIPREFKPYGPWTEPLIWQYHDTTSIAGFSVDLNVWNPALIPGVPPPNEGDPTLNVQPGREGLWRIGGYQVLYNAGIPIWRYGGSTPGATAKNFGGQWVYLRNGGDGSCYWTTEEGD